MTKALSIFAGKKAKAHIEKNGLQAADVRVVAGAAGGPKGLLLLGLDKFIFSEWLSTSSQPVDLLGASIGAWRMATACMNDSSAGFDRLTRDYIAQNYDKNPSAELVSREFSKSLHAFYDGHVDEVLNHPRYRLHILTSRGRGFLHQTNPSKRFEARTVLGFVGAFMANVIQRKAMGTFLERTVFSNHPLPFQTDDYITTQMPLTSNNFFEALQASCAIPFVLNAVNHIPNARLASYWDGGITDYHCHMNYAGALKDNELVLIPHFQKHLIAGWLDKSLKWRHHSTSFLDHVVVLAPTKEWVQKLPNQKIPDRKDFNTYADDFPGRVKVWSQAVSMSEQLVQEFKDFLEKQDMIDIL